MVLEEASQPTESFSEALPSNDEDPYSGDRNPTVLASRDSSYVQAAPGVYVNLNNLPKPFLNLAGSAHAAALGKAIQDSSKIASQVLERPIRQEEAEALGFHLAKSIRIGSYGAPIGLAVGYYQCYRTAGTLRFPGWTPNPEKFSPDKFLGRTGRRARFTWHLLRSGAYGIVGVALGQIFWGSYALTSGTAGRMMDPRLKDLQDKVKERQNQGRTGLPGGRQIDQTAARSDGETWDMARQRQRVQSHQKYGNGGDDMSPTGGSFGNEYGNVDKQQQLDTELMSDGQTQQRDRYFEQEGRRRQQEQQEESAVRTQRRQPVDDASPTSQESSPKQTGSAWERLRQQATSDQPQAPTRSSWGRKEAPSSPSSSDDRFSFSSGEEEKQLAKSEAQKQFDARLEKEREGKDFDDQSGGRKGWRS